MTTPGERDTVLEVQVPGTGCNTCLSVSRICPPVPVRSKYYAPYTLMIG